MRKEIDSSGTIWYYNDLNQWHREDGPAIEYANGSKYWYRNDQLHREDGPAIEFADGTKCWCFRGKHIDCETNEEFLQLMKMKAFW
jgi:hypothetical protein